mgnify:CR=1 FL=1
MKDRVATRGVAVAPRPVVISIRPLGGKVVKEKDESAFAFATPQQTMAELDVDQIVPDDEFNCRLQIDEKSANFLSLLDSVRTQGLKKPLLVTPTEVEGKFKLVGGYHRHRVLRILGIKRVLVVIEVYEDTLQALIANAVDNLHYSKLTAFVLGRICSRMRKAGMMNKTVAKKLSISDAQSTQLTSCVENLIPPLLEMFARQDDDLTRAEFYSYSRMDEEDQQKRLDDILQRRDRGNETPDDEKGDQKAGKLPKMKSRDALRAFMGDLGRAESIIVRGDEVSLDQDMVEMLTAVIRWATGELKKYPLVMPPDDRETQDEDTGRRKKK